MNCALKTKDDVMLSMAGIKKADLRYHETSYKNWDMWDFLCHATRKPLSFGAAILDVGCAGSPFLHNLASLGFKNLHGIDFDYLPGQAQHWPDRIRYHRGDLTKTPFEYGMFDMVTSLSVIEHGVDPEEYIREMSRILKPGGLLLTSTDYWPEKVRTWDVRRKKTFGLPWRILRPDDIVEIVNIGRRWGLEPTGALDFSVQDKVVNWEGKNYTFFSFALRKKGAE